MSRKIRYIGYCQNKRDNVAKSRTVWPLPGSVVEVPDDIAVRLLQFHTSFVEYGADNDPGDEIAYQVMTGTNESHYVNSKGEVIDSPDEVLDVQDVAPTDEVFSFSNDKDEAIRQAITMIDTSDTANLTTNKYPKAELIEGILGYPCSAPDRDRVWDQMEVDSHMTPADANGEVTEPEVVI